MSRSCKDGRGGHPQRWKSHGVQYDAVNTPAQHRFIKRSQRRLDRRNNKLDPRDPELIYPYLHKTSWYVKGSYLAFDFNEYDDWTGTYDWYCDMLDEYWAYQYDQEQDDYDEPDFYDHHLYDDHDYSDLDYYYDY